MPDDKPDKDFNAIIHSRLVKIIKDRKNQPFPLKSYTKQLEYLARDVLVVRQMAYGQIDYDTDKLLVPPDAELLLKAVRAMLGIIQVVAKEKDKNLTVIPTSDEISEDILNPAQQQRIDEA